MDIVEGNTVAYCGNLARTDRCKSFHSSLANIRMRVDDLNERQKAGSLPNAAVVVCSSTSRYSGCDA
jgi:hypothetical protein